MTEEKTPLLRFVTRACEMLKPAGDRWNVIQRVDNGLVVGGVGPSKTGDVGFAPDGATYILSAKALREIADIIDTHGLELAS